MRRKVLVLWEDSGAPRQQPNDFAPHQLALACLLDLHPSLARSAWELRDSVEAHPTRGVDKLLEKLARLQAEHIVAVPDSDRIRAHLGLPKSASDSEVLIAFEKIRTGARVVLLKRNMEDVVTHAAAVLGLPEPVSKSKPAQRDSIVRRLALGPAAETRALFLARMPSFAEVVNAIELMLRRANAG